MDSLTTAAARAASELLYEHLLRDADETALQVEVFRNS